MIFNKNRSFYLLSALLLGINVALAPMLAKASNGHAPAPYNAMRYPVRRLLVMGDSISVGLGATEPALSYAALLYHNDATLYPGDVGDDLLSFFTDTLQYIHVAHAGDTSQAVLQHQLQRLSAAPQHDVASLVPFPIQGHTIVVMTLGGNDVRAELGPGGNLTQGLRHTLQHLQRIFAFFNDAQRFPDGVSLYLASVYDITDGQDSAHLCLAGLRFEGMSQALAQWHAAYLALAAHYPSSASAPLRVHVVDAYHQFLGHGFHYGDEHTAYFDRHDPTLWLDEQDCIHPNNRGHSALRRAFYAAILQTFAP